MNNSENLLKMIDWLDKKRWSSKTNYNIIQNKIFEKLSYPEKILVHWISYITDRQTPFVKIWTDGGIVFSGIVFEYTKKGYNYFKRNPFFKTNSDRKFSFFHKDRSFSSRFITTDIKSILLVFKILEDYKRNIIFYVNENYNKFSYLLKEIKESNPINLIAFILHLLSYVGIKSDKSGEEKNLERYFNEVEEYYKQIKEIIADKERFKKEYSNFVKTRFSNKKRTWCCVRDYFKSYFKGYFLNALKQEKNNESLIKIFNDSEQKVHLELPGDVWNLNPVFRENLILPNLNISLKKNFAEELRNVLKSPYYPEEFDLTFDFVPRMCAHPNNKINKTMCKICPFGKSGMKQYCHQNPNLLCPITMTCCGYETKCNPKECPIKEGLGIGLCGEC